MAGIGEIVLGGRGCTTPAGTPIVSGVAFELSGPAPFSHTYIPASEPWEVELRRGAATIVARTSDPLGRSASMAQGLEQVQRCLDLLSFEKRQNLLVKRPADDHVILFVRDGAYILQHVAVSSLGMSFGAEVVVTDKDGNVVPPPPPPLPFWTPGLRFYRLSQASTDLYDAYRSLWLGLETLLDTICPKQTAEKERGWLVRAMTDVGNRIDLSQFAPKNCTAPVAYIIGTQYDHIRCRLFHAKTSQSSSLPDIPDPEEVASAYERLIRLWRVIAERCLSVRSGGGGAMTYTGFKMMLDNALAGQLTMYFTDDPTPIQKEDTEVSPKGRPVHPFDKVDYLSETSPGRVSFVGSRLLSDITTMPTVHRICSRAGGVLLGGWSCEQGLRLDGVDYLESYQTTRLVNRDLPRVVFGEDS